MQLRTHEAREVWLLDAAEQLACPLTTRQVNQLFAFLELLLRWNKTYNLTAIRDQDQMLVQHLADCLAVVGPLRRDRGVEPFRIADVGSGAGLPAVVLAIAEPGWPITSIDAVGKKTSFVQQVALELGLPNLTARHARVESLADRSFDLVVSRAFSDLSSFVAVSRGLLGERGCWMAMKGHLNPEETSKLPADIELFHVERLRIPDLAAERCLAWMRPRDERHSEA